MEDSSPKWQQCWSKWRMPGNKCCLNSLGYLKFSKNSGTLCLWNTTQIQINALFPVRRKLSSFSTLVSHDAMLLGKDRQPEVNSCFFTTTNCRKQGGVPRMRHGESCGVDAAKPLQHDLSITVSTDPTRPWPRIKYFVCQCSAPICYTADVNSHSANKKKRAFTYKDLNITNV